MHAVKLLHPLHLPGLLHADIGHQLLDLGIAVTELLHQLGTAGTQAVEQATDQRQPRALAQAIELETARNAHHLAELVTGGIQVAVAHLVKQARGKGRALAGRLTAKYRQPGQAGLVQSLGQLLDLGQVRVLQPQPGEQARLQGVGGDGKVVLVHGQTPWVGITGMNQSGGAGGAASAGSAMASTCRRIWANWATIRACRAGSAVRRVCCCRQAGSSTSRSEA